MYIKPNEFDLAQRTAPGTRLPPALVRAVGLAYLLLAGTLTLPYWIILGAAFGTLRVLAWARRGFALLLAAADRAGNAVLGRDRLG